MFRKIHKTISVAILAVFITTSVKSPAYAQLADDQMPRLPAPGVMVHLSPEFTSAHLQGITIHPDNALQFDFLIRKSDQDLEGDRRKEEYKKLVKYFLASLTIPDEDQWVNLSPYEKDRIIKDDFGKTEMGRDLLAQDYLLKQITSSLIYPENGLGKKFWDKIYERAWNEYHTTDVPVNTFNKVWIVPDQAYVYESGNTAYILQSHLKVMLEEDYLAIEKNQSPTRGHVPREAGYVSPSTMPSELGLNAKASQGNTPNALGSQVIREIILPELEKEVNEGKNFANLRQMYSGMILATWYKKALKESLLGKIYVDKEKVVGVNSQDPKANEEIYKRYLKAFKKGVFNYIKEDVDKYTNEAIPRKYFSGGWKGFDRAEIVTRNTDFNRTGVLLIADPATISFIPKIDMASLASENSLDRATVALNASGDEAMTTEKPIAIVVDDDSGVLEINKRILELKGFNVITAADIDELKIVMAEHGEKASLLVTDTTGWIEAVKEALSTVKRKIPIIAVSGANSRQDWEHAGVPVHAFLSKPYSISQFRAAVDGIPKDTAMLTAALKNVGDKVYGATGYNLRLPGYKDRAVDKNEKIISDFLIRMAKEKIFEVDLYAQFPKIDPQLIEEAALQTGFNPIEGKPGWFRRKQKLFEDIVPTNEKFPNLRIPFTLWPLVDSVNLENLEPGTLVYLFQNETRVNYLIRKENGDKIRLWLNAGSDQGSFILPGRELQGMIGRDGGVRILKPGIIEVKAGIIFPYFRTGKNGELLPPKQEDSWIQSFSSIHVFKPNVEGSTQPAGNAVDAAMNAGFSYGLSRKQMSVLKDLGLLEAVKPSVKNLVIVGNNNVPWGLEILALGNFTWSVLKQWPNLKSLYVITSFPEVVAGMDPRIKVVNPDKLDGLPKNLLIEAILNLGPVKDVQAIKKKILDKKNNVLFNINELDVLFLVYASQAGIARQKIRESLKQYFKVAPLDEPLLKKKMEEIKKRRVIPDVILINPYGTTNQESLKNIDAFSQRWAGLIAKLMNEGYKVKLSNGGSRYYKPWSDRIMQELSQKVDSSKIEDLVVNFDTRMDMVNYMAEHAKAVITLDAGPFHAAFELLGIPTVVLTTEHSEGWVPEKEEVGRLGRVIRNDFMAPGGENRVTERLSMVLNAGSSNAAMKAPGGIDFNAVNLNLQIKRDGNGVPLPLALQDMAQLSRIQGFEPEIIEIKPAVNLPILSELQQKLQTSAT